MKNKLRSYEVFVTVSTPRVIAPGSVLAPRGALRNRFVCDQGSLSGDLEVMVVSGFTFMDCAPRAPLIGEGELVLF